MCKKVKIGDYLVKNREMTSWKVAAIAGNVATLYHESAVYQGVHVHIDKNIFATKKKGKNV